MDIIALSNRFSSIILAPKSDDDFSDRLSYRYTAGLFILFSIIILTRQYGSDNLIKCWLPAHFTSNYAEYVTQVCWISNTYRVGTNESIWKDDKLKKQNEITYYQWVVFLLLIQAFMFYLPRIFWQTASLRAGVNLVDIIESALNYKHVDKFDKRDMYMKYMVSNIHQYVDDERRFDHKRPNLFQRIILGIVPFSGRYLGNYLVILYFFVKCMYIANTFMQALLISGVIGHNYFKFGYEFISTILKQNGKSIESLYFPKTAFCDFHIREVGNPQKMQRHTVQCVLPINLFNQQIFIAIWFWLLFVNISIFLETVKWINRCIPQHSSNWIKNRVILYNTHITDRNSPKLKHFINPYLEADGVFMIQMIDNNVGSHVAIDLINELWKKHTEIYGAEFEEEIYQETTI